MINLIICCMPRASYFFLFSLPWKEVSAVIPERVYGRCTSQNCIFIGKKMPNENFCQPKLIFKLFNKDTLITI